MTTNNSQNSTKLGDDHQEIFVFTEPWVDKPATVPFNLRVIRISGKLFSDTKKTPKLRVEVVNKSVLPLEVVEFIVKAYRTAAQLPADTNGDRRLIPNISTDANPWDNLWRLPPGAIIEVKHTLIIDEGNEQEIAYDLDCPPSLEEQWKVSSVTPRLWKLYEEKTGGPKLRIDIEKSVGSQRADETRRFPAVKFVPEDEKEFDRLSHDWDIRLRYLLFDEWNGSLSEDRLRKNRTRTEHGMKIIIDPHFDWSTTERDKYQNAIDRNDGQIVRVPILLCVEGAHPVTIQVEIVPYTPAFPGFLSVDLGNSASSVVLYDPALNDGKPRRVLPVEQLKYLRGKLTDWFSSPITVRYTEETGLAESTWLNKLLKPLARSLSLSENDPAITLCGYLNNTANRGAQGDKPFFELLRQLELVIDAMQDDKPRRICREKLHQFYSDAFLQFPFESREMACLEFEPAGKGTDNRTVPYTLSDLELSSVYPVPNGVIGWASRDKYKEWRRNNLRSDDATEESKSKPVQWKTEQWFTYCPKMYLQSVHKTTDNVVKKLRLPCFQEKDSLARPKNVGKENAKSDRKETQILPQTVVQAAWHALLNLVEEKRDALHLHSGPFESSVVTYPTSLLPEPRKEISRIFSELGVLRPDLLFDEAVSPTLFYFEQRFGMNNELGPEAFKVRCTHHYDPEYALHSWYHQMLILDIGAGTTDIAIVQICLTEEISVQKPDSGGRAYTIAPRLLGSTGSDQSGGNAITLNVFHYLKILLADYLVHHVGSDADKQVSWDIGNTTEEHFKELIRKTERELPTKYGVSGKDGKKRMQDADRFFALWDWAEKIKIEFSDRLSWYGRKDIFDYRLLSHWNDFRDKILAGTSYSSNPQLEIPEEIVFKYDKFNVWAESVFTGSIKAAVDLAKESLKNPSDDVGAPLHIDSIVLSGRACQLPLIREELEKIIRTDEEFASDRTEILFVPDFAKVATAVGACFGKRILQSAVQGNVTTNVPRLHAGLCIRNLNIDNLFFFLPSDFTLSWENQTQVIFQMQMPFKAFDLTNIGRIRTDDFMVMLGTMIIRRGSSVGNVFWGQLVLEALPVTDKELKENLKNTRVQFEIDHDLTLSALLLHPKPDEDNTSLEPYYLLDAPLDSRNQRNSRPAAYSGRLLTDGDKWKKYFYVNDMLPTVLNHSIYIGKPSDSTSRLILEAGTSFEKVCVRPVPFETDEVLQKNIDDMLDDPVQEMVNEVEEAQRLQAEETWFRQIKINGCWTQEAVATSRKKKGNILSEDATLELYAEISGEEHLFLAKIELKINQPQGTASSEPFLFEKDFRLLITQDGRYNVFIGDAPPYWETGDHRKWKWPGQIWRKTLDPAESRTNEEADPFNGLQ